MGFNWCFKTPISAKICWFRAFVFSEGIELGVWVLRMREEERKSEERGERKRENNKKYLQAATVNFIYESSL
jgi:hypothetical protein